MDGLDGYRMTARRIRLELRFQVRLCWICFADEILFAL